MAFSHRIIRTLRWIGDGFKWRSYHATLNESLEESKRRFGDVIHLSDSTSSIPQYEFTDNGIDISISYESDQAIRVWHSSEKAFPDSYIMQSLSHYAGNSQWVEVSEVAANVASLFNFGRSQPGRYFERSDKEAWACVGFIGRELSSMTFHFDITCGRWARIYNSRYGVWSIRNAEV